MGRWARSARAPEKEIEKARGAETALRQRVCRVPNDARKRLVTAGIQDNSPNHPNGMRNDYWRAELSALINHLACNLDGHIRAGGCMRTKRRCLDNY